MKAVYDDLRIGNERYATYAGVMNAEQAIRSFRMIMEEVRRHRWEDATWTFVSTWGDVTVKFNRWGFAIKRNAFGVEEQIRTCSLETIYKTLRSLDKPLLPFGEAVINGTRFVYKDVHLLDIQPDLLRFALERIVEFEWVNLTWKFHVDSGRMASVEHFAGSKTLHVQLLDLWSASVDHYYFSERLHPRHGKEVGSLTTSSVEEAFRFITQP